MVDYGMFDLVGFLKAIDGWIVDPESFCYYCSGANIVGYNPCMYKADVGVIRCNGIVGSGTDDESKVAIGTYSELVCYKFTI